MRCGKSDVTCRCEEKTYAIIALCAIILTLLWAIRYHPPRCERTYETEFISPVPPSKS